MPPSPIVHYDSATSTHTRPQSLMSGSEGAPGRDAPWVAAASGSGPGENRFAMSGLEEERASACDRPGRRPMSNPVVTPVVGCDGSGDGLLGVLPCLGLRPRLVPYANHPHSAEKSAERGWFAYSGSRPRQGKKKEVDGRGGKRRKKVAGGGGCMRCA